MGGLINNNRKSSLPVRESEPEPKSTYDGNKKGNKKPDTIDVVPPPKEKPKISTVRVTVDTLAQLSFLVGANKTKTLDDVIGMLLDAYVKNELNDTEKKLFDMHMEMQRERMKQ